MRIGILGSDGLPARYGGFETFVEQVSPHLVDLGHQVLVIGSSIGRPQISPAVIPAGVEVLNLPLSANGVASIAFDSLSMLLAARKVDAILMLGVSAGTLLPLLRIAGGGQRLVLNVDGLESRRNKWHGAARAYLRVAERVAMRNADDIISDNDAIAGIVSQQYGRQSTVIGYGNDHVHQPDRGAAEAAVYSIGLEPQRYLLTVARIEPENSIREMIEARLAANTDLPYVIVGNVGATDYGRELLAHYERDRRVRFLGPIYDAAMLGSLRSCASLYLHGHQVGGTNPSLVEVLPYRIPLAAFDCAFNRSTLAGECAYFDTSAALRDLIEVGDSGQFAPSEALATDGRFSWRTIAEAYATALGIPG